jgi:hypothetical protein
MLKAGTYVTCLDDDLQLIMWMLESFPFIWQRLRRKFAVLCWLCLEEKRRFICVGLWDKILA